MREFYVDTPVGKIHVWAKFDVDDPDDYPGVHIDLETDDGRREALATVEYDSPEKDVQTVVYQPGMDEPVQIIKQRMEDA